MGEQDFDRFDDNTFAVTISLAEYRSLVSAQAYAYQQINDLREQVEKLEARNTGLIEQVQKLQGEVMADDPDG